MASEFLIQVAHKSNGKVVAWAPGLEIEKEFEDELIDRVREKGVGVARTEKHVLRDVRAALKEMLFELKSKV